MSPEKREAAPLSVIKEVGTRVETTLEKLNAACDASAVFGPPEKVGDRVYIPAAAVQKTSVFGFGGGGGSDVSDGELKGSGGGGGAGGGGNAEGRPVAVIEIGPDGVRVKPVMDFTKIGLAAIGAALTIWRAAQRARRVSLD